MVQRRPRLRGPDHGAADDTPAPGAADLATPDLATPDLATPDLAVARQLAEMSRALSRSQGLTATLDSVCRLALARLAPGQDAAVSLLVRGAVHPAAATSDRARTAEELQAQLGEGPALAAVQGPYIVEVDDLATDHRWAAFGRMVVQRTGLRAALSVRLETGGPTIGVLSLYSVTAGSLRNGPMTTEIWSLFASHAAVALTGALALDGLREALESRETISVAMGILMTREAITREQAFDVLRRASQRENLKLRDIAARIAGGDGHALPPGPGR